MYKWCEVKVMGHTGAINIKAGREKRGGVSPSRRGSHTSTRVRILQSGIICIISPSCHALLRRTGDTAHKNNLIYEQLTIMGQSFNSSDISSAISDVHRAQRHFDGFDGVAMRLMRGEGHQGGSGSFGVNIDDGATSETAASTSSSVYSEDIYDDNAFESCLVGEMLSVALDQDMFVEDAVLPQEYNAAAAVEPSSTKMNIPALLILWTMACIASGGFLGAGVPSVFRTRWFIATVPVWAIGVLPFIGRVAHQFHLSQRPGH